MDSNKGKCPRSRFDRLVLVGVAILSERTKHRQFLQLFHYIMQPSDSSESYFVMPCPCIRWGRFFSRLSVQSAIGLYIFIVCLVYNLVLRGILTLTGWQLFVDTMLHVVVPVLYLLYWAFFRTKGTLKWQNGVIWILFPFFYLVYSLIRGPIVSWYPYPFLNAGKLGYNKVMLNIGVMLAIFLVAGLVLIFLTRLTKNKSAAELKT